MAAVLLQNIYEQRGLQKTYPLADLHPYRHARAEGQPDSQLPEQISTDLLQPHIRSLADRRFPVESEIRLQQLDFPNPVAEQCQRIFTA